MGNKQKTVGECEDIVVTINHGLEDYSIDFIQQIEQRIDMALGALGFSRSISGVEPGKCTFTYFQFAKAI